MARNQVKEILERVLTWRPEDQEKVARFVHAVEQHRADEEITDAEWAVIEARAARRDLATSEDVERLFGRYVADEASLSSAEPHDEAAGQAASRPTPWGAVSQIAG
jgi:hypothetical protein